VILLDTHVLVWLVAGSDRLGPRSRTAVQAAWDGGAAAVSSFTLWEIALLHAKGRLELNIPPRSLHRNLLADGLRVLPVDDQVAIRAAELAADAAVTDPADSIICATAIDGGHTLATADRQILRWATGRTEPGCLDART
jgi:PIN domain nuclease of toxin-antitoxin system